MPPAISIVIPAYNEAALLPRLLDSVDSARTRFHRGADAVEVIVADNRSTDATADLARNRGCQVARVETRCIAAARNGGAAVARAPLLCFVDADARIHPETFNAIAKLMDTRRFVGGATGVHLERRSAGLLATYAVLTLFVMCTGMDTGVVFCRREDFEAVGGYDERRAYAEDVAFLWALRRLGRSRGQRLVRARSVKAMASTRKFDTYGDWHYFTQIFRLAPAMLFDPFRRPAFVERYWYRDRTPSSERTPPGR